jgi:hypothetical protein
MNSRRALQEKGPIGFPRKSAPALRTARDVEQKRVTDATDFGTLVLLL